MKVILLKDIKGVGRRGEVKTFSDGYVQNFLIPQKIAEIATPDKVRKIESEKANTEARKEVQKDLLIKQLEPLDGKTVTIHRKVNSTGALFAKVEAREIVDAIQNETHIHVSHEYIHFTGEIKHTGEYEIRAGDKKKIGKEFALTLKVFGQ